MYDLYLSKKISLQLNCLIIHYKRQVLITQAVEEIHLLEQNTIRDERHAGGKRGQSKLIVEFD